MPGKGKGLVAIEKISKGTRILSEEAVVTVSESVGSERLRTSICKQVEALSENQRRDFLSIYNIHLYRNAAKDQGAIFLEACRINHACDNNTQKNWNKKIKRHTVHALRDINKGKEITITYLAPLKNRKARQKALQEKFDFTCLCYLCSLPLEQSQESDRRLEEIYRLDGRIFAERAATLAIKYGALAQDPSKYELFGVLTKWKTKSRTTFPGFTDLLDENNIDLEFYERSNIEIKDINSTIISLYFYTNSRGITILYTERHAFMFCEPGICYKDP
ncbi:SET domain-containing protein [Hyaloscypha bicolor E]|uniref:SET domain-containing protein n=1 Tax=Hyaloscypha bicolor E TaxID=1095630 RepID=A0A2J6TBE8_9HELO|nr:SET domain-containing protein [Hyaloscypha bicolor E]PMD60357.1 SET domain-containing protein [Hyaloscypha bicolor E]